VEIIGTILRFFQEGGLFMYIILGVLALGAVIALERHIYLTQARWRNRRTWNQLFPLLRIGEWEKATVLAGDAKTPLGNVIAYGLSNLRAGQPVENVELAMEEGLMEIVPRLERRTPYVAILANIATLLGLLGTIVGLIEAFGAVSNADPAEKANLLSSSISLAMNTTAFGLIAAIPLLLIHALLQTKTTDIVDSLEMASVKVLNLIRQPVPGGRRDVLHQRKEEPAA
jgi:biopolymer transport protein ExbB/TolQ